MLFEILIVQEPFLSNMWEPKLFKASKAITPVSGNNTKPEQALELVEFLATGTVLQRSSSNQHFDFEKWTRNVANRPQTSQRYLASLSFLSLIFYSCILRSRLHESITCLCIALIAYWLKSDLALCKIEHKSFILIKKSKSDTPSVIQHLFIRFNFWHAHNF